MIRVVDSNEIIEEVNTKNVHDVIIGKEIFASFLVVLRKYMFLNLKQYMVS